MITIDKNNEWMDGWVDGWMDGWMVGWLGGWVDGWVDGWIVKWMELSEMVMDSEERKLTDRQLVKYR